MNLYFPHGDVEGEKGININMFRIFINAGIFIADLGDILVQLGLDRKNISARVHLNSKSNIKTLNGIELIDLFI